MTHRTSLGSSLAAQERANERNVRRWEKAGGKWPWRDFLTDEEREILAKADAAKAEWTRLNQARASITNRAIQRAKYAATREPSP